MGAVSVSEFSERLTLIAVSSELLFSSDGAISVSSPAFSALSEISAKSSVSPSYFKSVTDGFSPYTFSSVLPFELTIS